VSWPKHFMGLPLGDASVESLSRGDVIAWDEEDLYLVLNTTPAPWCLLRLLNLESGEVIENKQSGLWAVRRML